MGYRIDEYWDLTLDDINKIVGARNKQLEEQGKETIVNSYLLASLVAEFVGLSLSGKSKPSLQELFPDVFATDIQKIDDETKQELETAMLREQWIDLANIHNSKFRKKLAKDGGTK